MARCLPAFPHCPGCAVPGDALDAMPRAPANSRTASAAGRSSVSLIGPDKPLLIAARVGRLLLLDTRLEAE